MKALVAGATGQTGRRIVQELVKRGIAVRALVRDAEAARSMLPTEAELVVGDVLQPATLTAALKDCTVLLCATGAKPGFDPTGPYKVDYEGTQNLVDAAKTAGIEHFVLVTSLCTSQFFHPLNLFFLILVWKKRAEEYLQQSGLTYTIVRPGGLLNDENADSVVMSGADTLSDGRIPRTKVAQTCVEALFQSSARNKIVEIVAKPDAPAKTYEELFVGVG
ncbi:SDR family oxidoreductase [Leptolyngbya sp. FACHB-36]|uniref:SDR family oxidoreductase n=1 Tax=Leptolyngbya sp. FACHB-36 TaxID=2692808 RepID=UPI0016816054|nr:SDR family oxidoreductase [Leptolyngbya sp. FACHB-36]MBD2020377.1 SDR family oxidoreductase [Leptolyngbya sp. FACHB-36]